MTDTHSLLTREVTVTYSGHEALHPTSLAFAPGTVTGRKPQWANP